jgi:hypothetical protein
MSQMGHSRRSDRAPMTSGVPPDKQTFSVSVGRSQRCQHRTSHLCARVPELQIQVPAAHPASIRADNRGDPCIPATGRNDHRPGS